MCNPAILDGSSVPKALVREPFEFKKLENYAGNKCHSCNKNVHSIFSIPDGFSDPEALVRGAVKIVHIH